MSGTMIESRREEVFRDYWTDPGLLGIAKGSVNPEKDRENRKLELKRISFSQIWKSVQPKDDIPPIIHRLGFPSISIINLPRFHLGIVCILFLCLL